jgi:hypothetical protein
LAPRSPRGLESFECLTVPGVMMANFERVSKVEWSSLAHP